MFHRPGTVARRVVGIIMLIPGLLRVPLPQADFHVIRHHHGVGEVCSFHDHLLRWHPLAGEAEDVAVLHWHWLLPQVLDLDLAPIAAPPALHAHVADSLQPEWDDAQVVLSDDRASASSELASWMDLAQIAMMSVDWLPPEPPSACACARLVDAEPSAATALSRLVRWNC
jgi:hypothetical protein